MARVITINSLAGTFVTMSDLTQKDPQIQYSTEQLQYGQELQHYSGVASLLRDGYLMIPTLPWHTALKPLLGSMGKHRIINLQEDSFALLQSSEQKELLPPAKYIITKPVPSMMTLDRIYAGALNASCGKYEHVPTILELIYAAFVCRLVKSEILAPGLTLRSSTNGDLPGSHLGMRSSYRDGVAAYTILDSFRDPIVGTPAFYTLE